MAHCSALADLRSSTASLASTMEAVASTLARFAPGTCASMWFVMSFVTPLLDVDQGDALALSHAVADIVTSLRNDSHRIHAQFLRVQVRIRHAHACGTGTCLSRDYVRLTQLLQGELEDVLSKENSAARRMSDVDSVVESLRKRITELQGKLEAEMATAAQLPDALDQVLFAFGSCIAVERAASHRATAGVGGDRPLRAASRSSHQVRGAPGRGTGTGAYVVPA